MDDEDFIAVIEEFERQLRINDAGEIANLSHYAWFDAETDEFRIDDSQKRLVLMLQAFGRKLATEDHATYSSALRSMNSNLDGNGPRGAVVDIGGDNVVDLDQAPELGEIRRDLHRLIAEILEVPHPGRET